MDTILSRLLHKIAEGRKEHVARLLDEKAKERKAQVGEDLTAWRTSIVDVMKLAGEDSSFDARASFAEELGISDYNGTTEQNRRLADEFVRRLD